MVYSERCPHVIENESRPDYTGKATVYLDQNVLDLAVKEKDPAFFSRLMNNYQVVYSDDTLREIKRSGQPEVFLTALESMSAMHFKYQTDHILQPTGGMLITSHSPFQTYETYLGIEPIYDVMLAAAHQTNLKLYADEREVVFPPFLASKWKLSKPSCRTCPSNWLSWVTSSRKLPLH